MGMVQVEVRLRLPEEPVESAYQQQAVVLAVGIGSRLLIESIPFLPLPKVVAQP
jgi:hypothetical protein